MNPVYKTLIISFIGNALLIVLKVTAGFITNTKMLIADGIHSLSDLATDIMSIIGQKLSNKKADVKHPRGHGKIQYITSIIIGTVIVFLAIKLAQSAINSPVKQISNNIIGIVIITIIAKYFLAKYIYNNGIKYNNNILITGGLESRADVLSSIAVLLTVFASNFSSMFPILKYSDRIGTIIISLFILKTGYCILKENLSSVLGESETDEEILNIVRDIINKVKEVREINEVVLIKYGSYYDACIKISVDKYLNIEEAHKISKKVKKKLLKSDLNITYVTTHINPYEYNN